jgi:hypothetical protein
MTQRYRNLKPFELRLPHLLSSRLSYKNFRHEADDSTSRNRKKKHRCVSTTYLMLEKESHCCHIIVLWLPKTSANTNTYTFIDEVLKRVAEIRIWLLK